MYDVAVVGAGLAGKVAALALSQYNTQVQLWEREPNAGHSIDTVPITLRNTSVEFLKKIGVWQYCASTAQPITRVHAIAENLYGKLSWQRVQPALAYTLERGTLHHALDMALTKSAVEYEIGEVKTIHPGNNACELVNGASQQAQSVRRVILTEGAAGILSSCLAMECTRAGDYHSGVYLAQAKGWPEGCAIQHFSTKKILGIIPTAEVDQVWVIVTQPRQIPLPCIDALTHYIQEQRALRTKAIIASCYGNFDSSLCLRSLGSCPYAINLGQAALSSPPVAAQSFNFSLMEIERVTQLQRQLPWQEARASTWQRIAKRGLQPTRETQYKLWKTALWAHHCRDVFAELANKLGWAWLTSDASALRYLRALALGEVYYG